MDSLLSLLTEDDILHLKSGLKANRGGRRITQPAARALFGAQLLVDVPTNPVRTDLYKKNTASNSASLDNF